MFIIEYKMNVHHKQKGLKYIGDRDYVRHLLKYLLINENDVLKGIDTIGQIGISIHLNIKINKKKLKQKHYK